MISSKATFLESMRFTIPNKIKILSDGNELQFIKTIKLKNEVLYQYRFVVSKTKLNLECEFTEKELLKNLRNFFKIIEDENS